jgi:SAM-dependent methyltransferase
MNGEAPGATLFSAAKSVLRRAYNWGPSKCPACGTRTRLRRQPVMWRELGDEWELSPALYREFDEREGIVCGKCGSSIRARQLAEIIVAELNSRLGCGHRSLAALCRSREAAALEVAEINSAGSLHQFLAVLPGLRFSEYGSEDPAVPSEDLLALSYEPGVFDLVVTSETLEHVPDFDAALAEIRRVLKPDGQHIFTIPVVWDRATRIRASVRDGEIVEHLPPSYHGVPKEGRQDFLVFYEFGGDVVETVRRAGFDLRVVKDSRRPTVATFVTTPLPG